MKKNDDAVAFTKRGITLREKFSSKVVLYSALIFLISLIFYKLTSEESIMAVTGLFIIISGSITVLFTIIYLVFYFLENSKYKKSMKEDKGASKNVGKPVRKKRK